MANMFSGNVEKRIPKSLYGCYGPDPISSNLWNWSEGLEKLGVVLFILMLIGGIFTAISGAKVVETVVVQEATYFSDAKTEVQNAFKWGIFFAALIEGIFYAILEYLICHTVALLVGALASIVQHTRITANVNLYSASRNENPPPSAEEAPKKDPTESALSKMAREIDEKSGKAWACGKCGYVNVSGVYCKDCGEYKAKAGYKEVDIKTIPKAKEKSKEWTCKKCGEKNSSGMYCKSCGEYK